MNTLGFLFGGQPGLPEVLLIVLIIVLLFGAKRLPGLARSLGQSIQEFKRGRKESGDEQLEDETSEKPAASPEEKDVK